MRLLAVLAAATVLAVGAPAFAGPELDPLRQIAIQDAGRLKPLDTFARESARRIVGAKPFGGESVLGLDPVEWLLAMQSAPERWKAEPIVRVAHAGLRAAVGLPADKDRFAFAQLVAHQPFMDAADRIRGKLQADAEAKLDPIEKEITELYETLSLMAGIFSGEALKIVPADDPKAAWFSIADLKGAGSSGAVQARALLAGLIEAYGKKDAAGIASAAARLQERLHGFAPGVYPAAQDLAREVHYNRLKPFRLAWILYLLAFLVLLASLPLGRFGPAGLALASAGFLSHLYGMLLRTLISGRAPVTNMYESVVFVAWGAILFALVFEYFNPVRFVAACASGLAVVALILADSVPILDASIAPLVPVLRDNLWLTCHVLTISLGYAAFFLATGIGHVNIALYFLAPARAALFKTLSLFLLRSLQAGTLFLAAGTLLGGVWASYSWGRFWGWDPKETWALIALLGYLGLLHGRVLGWIKDFGLAVGSILGFLLVLMAWYGVNYLLGTGLHSYGFGSGGYGTVGTFVGFEVLVVVAAALRYRSAVAPRLAAASVSSAS